MDVSLSYLIFALYLKARTHATIFGESVLESADSALESALESADSSTIVVWVQVL